MIEGHLGKVQRRLAIPEPGIGDGAGERYAVIGIGDDDQSLESRQARQHLAQALAHLDGMAVVAIALDREQHLRPDLAEAVEDSSGAELGRARGLHGPEARGGQHGTHGLGDVWQIARDAIPDPDASGSEPRGEPRHLPMQLGT